MTPDLTPDDYVEIAKTLREALAGDKFFLAPRYQHRKAILAKLEPQRERQVFPPPQPAGEPTWAERVKRNRRR